MVRRTPGSKKVSPCSLVLKKAVYVPRRAKNSGSYSGYQQRFRKGFCHLRGRAMLVLEAVNVTHSELDSKRELTVIFRRPTTFRKAAEARSPWSVRYASPEALPGSGEMPQNPCAPRLTSSWAAGASSPKLRATSHPSPAPQARAGQRGRRTPSTRAPKSRTAPSKQSKQTTATNFVVRCEFTTPRSGPRAASGTTAPAPDYRLQVNQEAPCTCRCSRPGRSSAGPR